MPRYNHDYLHCSQKDCKRKDTYWRYWLEEELKNTEYQYASFYFPQSKEDLESCKYYENIKEH